MLRHNSEATWDKSLASTKRMAANLFDLQSVLAQLVQAAAEGKLTTHSVSTIRSWLSEPRYAEYAVEVGAHIAAGKWKQLDDVFWTVIPFGTGGRRGMMYPIGSNAINDRTIGESAQGLADYVVESQQKAEGRRPNEELGCAIAYDTRHNSRHFAELCAEIMAAAGFKVHFLDGYRSTPELSFAVRYTNSICGIMVTASHNPPSDNAVKVYWAGGVQVLPPHDKAIIERVMNVSEIRRRPFAEALAAGQISYCQKEIDAAFIAAVKSQSLPGPRELKIVYSPLHGVGVSAVLPALAADGFKDVETFGPHAEPSGDFPNVPGNVSNPENPRVFDNIVEHAANVGADLVLATDPDCDRLGAAAPRASKGSAEWKSFTGNQIAALLAEFVLTARKKAGSLSPQHYVCKTLVTTEMVRRIADQFNVQTYGDLQVGFKWIGKEIDDKGPENFVFGCEESHGYLVGTHVRDKDAAVAAMLLAELAATCKAEGKTLHEKLDALYWQYGYHAESQISLTMPGAAGMQDMQNLMARFRNDPPQQLAGMTVVRVRDYKSLTELVPGKSPTLFTGPAGDMVMLDFAAKGNYVAVRPSGTEPKVKFYMFSYEPAEQIANLEDTKEECGERLKRLEQDLLSFARSN
jgi:phosphomannomutase